MHEITALVLAECPTAVVRRRLEAPQIASWVGPAVDRVVRAVTAAGMHPAGPRFARYLHVEHTAACFDVEAGVVLAHPWPADPTGRSDVLPSRLPGGPAALTVHAGPYEAVTPAHEALEKWIAEHGGVPDGPSWECYLTEPVGDPDTWRTEVVQPYTFG